MPLSILPLIPERVDFGLQRVDPIFDKLETLADVNAFSVHNTELVYTIVQNFGLGERLAVSSDALLDFVQELVIFAGDLGPDLTQGLVELTQLIDSIVIKVIALGGNGFWNQDFTT